MVQFRRLASAVLLVALGVGISGLAAKPATPVDWPHFRFDEKHTGYQPFETTLNKDNIIFAGNTWRAQLGKPVYGSSPTVVNGIVYIGSSDGVLWAYSADGCGQELCTQDLWHSTYLAQILDAPAVANGIVYVGSQTDFNSNDGKLNAFAADGCGKAACPPLWQGDAGPESILDSSPAAANGLVFVGTFAGTVYAFDAEGCGKKLCKAVWFGQTGDHIESSPTIYKGTLFIGANDGKLYAYKAKGCRRSPCRPLWTAQVGDVGDPVVFSSPAISKGLVYINSQHALAAFNADGCGADTCQPVWKAVDNVNFFDGSPAVANGYVYVPWEGEIAVYKAKGCGQAICEKKWQLFASGAQAAIGSAPTIANGVVYAGRNTAEIIAWSADPCGQQVCNELWKGHTNGQVVDSSPTVVNGKIYIGSADNNYPEDIRGRIYVYELQN